MDIYLILVSLIEIIWIFIWEKLFIVLLDSGVWTRLSGNIELPVATTCSACICNQKLFVFSSEGCWNINIGK